MAKRKRETFSQVYKSLIDVLKTSYKLAPCLVMVLTMVIAGVTAIAVLSTKLMVAVVLLVVLAATVIVYATTGQFGEATLALVAGLLTAYSVTWTPNRFIAFIGVWSAFCSIALMIASVKIAAKSESIYRQAAIAYTESEEKQPEVEKRLHQIGDDRAIQGIGPIVRAETLLLFSYRKIPLEVMPVALKAVAMLSVITQIDSKIMAVFVADVFKVFDFVEPLLQGKIIDIVYHTLQRSAVPPADFIRGFENSRHLVLSRSVGPMEFFDALKKALETGAAPEICVEVLVRILKINQKD